ncbi:MAG TPA: NirA family protein [Verrucomicrobiae bacterium]|nr:NirA family protein [Verrucomicrobiae bacterium]
MASTETVAEAAVGFTPEQKEYLAGFLAGAARLASVSPIDAVAPAPAGNSAVREEMIHGTPVGDATKQERWKHEEHPLDGWDRILAHAEASKLPDEEHTFRFRNFGLFFVGPTQNSLMLRCRIPAGELSSAQLIGLADMADEFGNWKIAITTRANIQIREIAPRNMVNVLTRLQSLGLTARGSGVDNIRNITASPTAGFDPQELIDTRPFAHALHHYILNHREFYNLPRKFNVAFEGGGSVDTAANTNDIGFMAVSVGDGAERGVQFRVELCGITGHKQLARDCGILVKPSEAVAVAAAMIRVFIENGNRTDRKKARLKYLVDRWGVERFLGETQKKLSFPLVRFPLEKCVPRKPPLPHGHIGVYRQKQKGRNYIGAVIPVGVVTSRQVRRIAELAANYGSSQVRLTPWQNLLIPDVADGFVETVKRQLVRAGLHHAANSIVGGLVACTGNSGCKFAASDTKGHALEAGQFLSRRVQIDHPVNIHFTGCPNSCAQHYIGDIGLQGVKVNSGGSSVEGYNIVLGGGCGIDAAIGKDVFKGIAFSEVPALLERILKVYQARREPNESFVAFVRRHELRQLQEMFSE